MKKVLFIILIFVSGTIISQSDPLKTEPMFGCSASLITFIDYGIVKELPFYKNAYYQGFDVNLFVRSQENNVQFDIGFFAGDSYPILKNLNYYVGGVFFLESKSRKYIFDFNPKAMYAYSSEPTSSVAKIIRSRISVQLGLNVYRKVKKMEFGLGYYFWVSDYNITKSDQSTKNLLLYHEHGFVPIGILKLSARYIIKK